LTGAHANACPIASERFAPGDTPIVWKPTDWAHDLIAMLDGIRARAA
jgi:hypothetical protein